MDAPKVVGRRPPNPVRFPHVINVAVSVEIADALERARLSFVGLGSTASDVVRLALFEWLSARGFHQSTNGKHEEQTHHAAR